MKQLVCAVRSGGVSGCNIHTKSLDQLDRNCCTDIREARHSEMYHSTDSLYYLFMAIVCRVVHFRASHDHNYTSTCTLDLLTCVLVPGKWNFWNFETFILWQGDNFSLYRCPRQNEHNRKPPRTHHATRRHTTSSAHGSSHRHYLHCFDRNERLSWRYTDLIIVIHWADHFSPS